MPFNQGPAGKWKVYAVISDDRGATWRYGATAIWLDGRRARILTDRRMNQTELGVMALAALWPNTSYWVVTSSPMTGVILDRSPNCRAVSR